MTSVLVLPLCLQLVTAAAPESLASRLSAADLAKVKKGEILVRRTSSGGRVESVVAGRIDAPPSWVFERVSDHCHQQLKGVAEPPRYVDVSSAETAVSKALPKKVAESVADRLPAITCAQAMQAATSFTYSTWDLPFPLPDGWTLMRGIRTQDPSHGGGSLRTRQVAGSMKDMEYSTEVVPLETGSLLVTVGVFYTPVSMPDFLLGDTDQTSPRIRAYRKQAAGKPWEHARPKVPAP